MKFFKTHEQYRFKNENSLGNLIGDEPTSLENFYKWCNGSKAVDSYNRPLVCYHVSNSTFDTFKEGENGHLMKLGSGIYFTTDIRCVNRLKREKGDILYECYLKMENPIVLENPLKSFNKTIDNDGIIAGLGLECDEIKVVRPNQIKSIYNKGMWSNDNNIYY